MMANRRRGEIEAGLDGERRVLVLTLGALAELETAFGAADLSALAARFGGQGLGEQGLVWLSGQAGRRARADHGPQSMAASRCAALGEGGFIRQELFRYKLPVRV